MAGFFLSEDFDFYNRMILPLHEWQDEGHIQLPGKYSSSHYDAFDIWFLKVFGYLDPNFELKEPIPAGATLPEPLKESFKKLHAGDWRWVSGPHGLALLKALLVKKGLADE